MNLNHLRILKILKELEAKHDIEIIFAVDRGSRAKNLHSEISDYDVGFVFIHNRKILNFNNYAIDSIVCAYDEKLYEFSGWSLTKAEKHMKESNCGFMEWLHSPYVLINKFDFHQNAKSILYQIHNKLSLFYHYSSIAENNYKTFIKGNNEVICKKYVYTIQPILMVMYLHDNTEDKRIIVSDFYELLTMVSKISNTQKEETRTFPPLTPEIVSEIERVVHLKKTHVKTMPTSELLNKWVISSLEVIDKMKAKKSKKKGDTIIGRAIQSTYSKMCSEIKKILTMSRASTLINVNNYRSTIFQTLKFLWVMNNQDKDLSEMTTVPLELFKSVEHNIENESIKRHIMHLITFDAEKDNELAQKTKQFVFENGLAPVLKFLKLIDPDCALDESVTPETVRKDMCDYLIRNALQINCLLENPSMSSQDNPKNIFSVKREIRAKNDILFGKCGQLIKDLKSVGIVDVIPELNAWLVEFQQKYELEVNEYMKKIREIIEINALSRYRESINKISKNEFTTFVEKIIFA